jgi:hypothetical protein
MAAGFLARTCRTAARVERMWAGSCRAALLQNLQQATVRGLRARALVPVPPCWLSALPMLGMRGGCAGTSALTRLGGVPGPAAALHAAR